MNRLSIVGDAKGKGSENGEGKGKGKGGKNANRCPVALLGGPLGPLNFSVAKNCHIKVGVGRPPCLCFDVLPLVGVWTFASKISIPFRLQGIMLYKSSHFLCQFHKVCVLSEKIRVIVIPTKYFG